MKCINCKKPIPKINKKYCSIDCRFPSRVVREKKRRVGIARNEPSKCEFRFYDGKRIPGIHPKGHALCSYGYVGRRCMKTICPLLIEDEDQ